MPDTPVKMYGEFSEDDPRFQVKILAMRVDALTKEKEEIEKTARELEVRLSAMERTFQRGAGAMIVIPVVGAIVGFIFAYGKVIFAPWTKGGGP